MLLVRQNASLCSGVYLNICEIILDNQGYTDILDKVFNHKFSVDKSNNEFKLEFLEFLLENGYDKDVKGFWSLAVKKLYTGGLKGILAEYSSTSFMKKEFSKALLNSTTSIKSRSIDMDKLLPRFCDFFYYRSSDKLGNTVGSYKELMASSFNFYIKDDRDYILKLANSKGTVVKFGVDTLSLVDTLEIDRTTSPNHFSFTELVRLIYEGSSVAFTQGSSLYYDLFSMYVSYTDTRKVEDFNDEVRNVFCPNSARPKKLLGNLEVMNGLYFASVRMSTIPLSTQYKENSFKLRTKICSIIIREIDSNNGVLSCDKFFDLSQRVINLNNSKINNSNTKVIGSSKTNINDEVSKMICGLISAKRLYNYCLKRDIDPSSINPDLFRDLSISARFTNLDDYIKMWNTKYSMNPNLLVSNDEYVSSLSKSSDLCIGLTASNPSLNFSNLVDLINKSESGKSSCDSANHRDWLRLAKTSLTSLYPCLLKIIDDLGTDFSLSLDFYKFIGKCKSVDELTGVNSTVVRLFQNLMTGNFSNLLKSTDYPNDKLRCILFMCSLNIAVYSQLQYLSELFNSNLSESELLKLLNTGKLRKIPLELKSYNDLASLGVDKLYLRDEIKYCSSDTRTFLTSLIKAEKFYDSFSGRFNALFTNVTSNSTEVAVTTDYNLSMITNKVGSDVLDICKYVYPFVVDKLIKDGTESSVWIKEDITFYNSKIQKLIDSTLSRGITFTNAYGVTKKMAELSIYLFTKSQNQYQYDNYSDFEQFKNRCSGSEKGYLVINGSLVTINNFFVHEAGFLVSRDGEYKMSVPKNGYNYEKILGGS